MQLGAESKRIIVKKSKKKRENNCQKPMQGKPKRRITLAIRIATCGVPASNKLKTRTRLSFIHTRPRPDYVRMHAALHTSMHRIN